MKKAKTETPDKLGKVRKGILDGVPKVKKLQRALALLTGIMVAVSEDKQDKVTRHRAKTIVGYRKTVLKASGSLYNYFAALEQELSLTE